MTRRGLLKALLMLPVAATLDVEKLLWIPGQMVTVPALSLSEVNSCLKEVYLPAILNELNRENVLLKYLEQDHLVVEGRDFDIPIVYT